MAIAQDEVVPSQGASFVPEPVEAPSTSLGNGDNKEEQIPGQDGDGTTPPPEKVVFPPPMSWYRSSTAASRDDMWAYCAAGVIVVVHPPPTLPKIVAGGAGVPSNVDTFGAIPDLKSSHDSSRWPKFSLIGAQLEKYNALSFCQTSWDYLPVGGAPLVTGCERGIVRVWNLEKKSTVIFHDNHDVS